MGSEDGFETFSLTQLFENNEYAVTDYLMIIECVSLSDYHIREITPQSIAPKITDVFGTFRILRNITPVIGYFDSEISRPTVYCQPSVARFDVFAIFDEMIAAPECADAFVEHPFLKFDAVAEVCDETCIYAGSFVDKVWSSRAGFLILRVQKTKQFFFIE